MEDDFAAKFDRFEWYKSDLAFLCMRVYEFTTAYDQEFDYFEQSRRDSRAVREYHHCMDKAWSRIRKSVKYKEYLEALEAERARKRRVRHEKEGEKGGEKEG